jgi:hypothetical protein
MWIVHFFVINAGNLSERYEFSNRGAQTRRCKKWWRTALAKVDGAAHAAFLAALR